MFLYLFCFITTGIILIISTPDVEAGLPLKFGTCLVPNAKQNFEPLKFFTGHWYKQSGIGSLFLDIIGNCPTIEYQVTDNGTIETIEYVYNPLLQKYLYKEGSSSIYSIPPTNIGYLVFKYELAQGLIDSEFPMFIIDTDYDNWAVVYYCTPSHLPFLKIEAAWIMSRTRDGSKEFDQSIIKTVNDNGLNYNQFWPEHNKGCGPIEPHL